MLQINGKKINNEKKKYGDKPFVPFHSNLYEDLKLSNDYDGQINANMDSSVKGYFIPGI